jgi:hypothetical protein
VTELQEPANLSWKLGLKVPYACAAENFFVLAGGT